MAAILALVQGRQEKKIGGQVLGRVQIGCRIGGHGMGVRLGVKEEQEFQFASLVIGLFDRVCYLTSCYSDAHIPPPHCLTDTFEIILPS